MSNNWEKAMKDPECKYMAKVSAQMLPGIARLEVSNGTAFTLDGEPCGIEEFGQMLPDAAGAICRYICDRANPKDCPRNIKRPRLMVAMDIIALMLDSPKLFELGVKFSKGDNSAIEKAIALIRKTPQAQYHQLLCKALGIATGKPKPQGYTRGPGSKELTAIHTSTMPANPLVFNNTLKMYTNDASVALYVSNWDKIKRLPPTVKQFILFISSRIFQSSPAERLNIATNGLTFTIDDYMKARNNKNKKETLKELEQVTGIAVGMRYSSADLNWGGKKGDVIGAPFVYGRTFNRKLSGSGRGNEIVSVTMSVAREWIAYIGSRALQPYPMKLLAIDPHKNPGSFAIGYWIMANKNNHRGAKSEDIYVVGTLLEHAPYPDGETIKNSKTRSVKRRVLMPLLRDLDYFADEFSYHFEDKNKRKLSIEEVEKVAAAGYKQLCELRLRLKYKNYPSPKGELLSL